MADRGRAGGVFITLEGPDGAGKSSQLADLGERIRSTGRQVVITREPGGTAIGERIRDVVLQGQMRGALTDALLFSAARAELVARVIRPALDSGAVVICDRYADSTLAYQGYGGGVRLDGLRAVLDVATGGLRPDRTVLFDLSPEAGLRRRAAGAQSDFTRFEAVEQHDLEFHHRVRSGYHEMAAAEPGRWRIIDADQPAADVAAALWSAVADLFG
jgi:dTMP kinase